MRPARAAVMLGPGFRGLVGRKSEPVCDTAGVVVDEVAVTLSDAEGAWEDDNEEGTKGGL